jgi:exopolysaccharide production protein ExoQ
MVVIMIVPQGFNYLVAMPTEGDPLSRTVWFVLLGGGGYLAARHGARTLALLRTVNPFFLAFVVLATLSVVWSIEPSITVRRLIRLYTMLLVCIGFTVVAWHARRFQTYLRIVLTAILLASAIFCLTDPEIAIHHEASAELVNAWHGITTSKNLLGSLSSCALVLWLHGWLAKDVGKFTALGGGGLAALCLIMSRSSTSLMATLFALFFLLLLLRSPTSMRRSMPYLIGIFAIAVLGYALAVLHLVPGSNLILEPITALTSKDQTFTGRTQIWYLLNLHIKLHPLFGTGYGAYWIGPIPSSPSYEMIRQLYFYPTEGHNGYLDVINDLGFVGGACLLGYFITFLRQALRLMTFDRSQGALYLALIFRGFLADMSESHWFSVLSVDFVIFTLATFALARDLIHSQLQRREGVPVRRSITPPPSLSHARQART